MSWRSVRINGLPWKIPKPPRVGRLCVVARIGENNQFKEVTLATREEDGEGGWFWKLEDGENAGSEWFNAWSYVAPFWGNHP